MKKSLNILLLGTFVLTVMVPLTGVHIHKLASLLFLVLCLVHTGIYWKRMNARRFLALGLIVAAFLSGVFGMIFEQYPIVLALHKMLSIVLVFCLAIHIFLFSRRLGSQTGRKADRERLVV